MQMSFRKNSVLFCQNIILLSVLSLLFFVVGCISSFYILYFCAVSLLITALISSKLDREYITIDEWGIACKRGEHLCWSYDWAHIADLRRSSRFRLPSVEVILYVKSGEPELFASAGHYFQLGRSAKTALSKYYRKSRR